MLRDGILDAIGHTPLVRLARLFDTPDVEVFAKLEALNPGGSLKDRPAWLILKRALDAGEIDHDTVVVESSSGNMGIGLAQACRYLDLRFICVIDPRTTAQNVELLRAYGAEVDLVSHPDPASGEFLQARIARVRALLAENPRSFWPDQYANLHNPEAHFQSTMHEIVADMDGRVDFVFCATSTCGTLRGCAEYVRSRGMDTQVVAVDALGSAIFGGERASRIIPGFGAGLVPELFHPGLANTHVHVTSLECVVGCRRLARAEAILAGGSSGGVVTAFERMLPRIPLGSRCALVFCDRGERYLDTIFNDAWVARTFGEAAHLWSEPRMVAA